MKWLFSILLIANLGLLIWLLPQYENETGKSRGFQDIGQLRLAGEQPAQADPGNTEAVKDQPAVGLSDSISDERPEPPAAREAPVPPTPTVAAEPVASESPKPVLAQPIEAPKAVCGTLGAFDKRADAEMLSVRLLAEGAKTEITAEASNDQAGYWVLIPPQKDRDTAIAISKRLEAAGVADLWRFTSGNLAHAISLGLFRDEERAQARRDQIAALGFKPEVQPRYREQTRYWLNYRFTGKSPLNAARWDDISGQFSDLERSEKTCP